MVTDGVDTLSALRKSISFFHLRRFVLDEPSKWFHSMVEEYINEMSTRILNLPQVNTRVNYQEMGIYASISRVKQIAAIVIEAQNGINSFPSNRDFAAYLEQKVLEIREQSIRSKVIAEGQLMGHEVIGEIMKTINKALGIEDDDSQKQQEDDQELIPFILK